MAPSNSNPYLGKSVISASQTLSRKIVDCFCVATGAKNQGVMQTDTMSGINWSSIPVSIVENGIHDQSYRRSEYGKHFLSDKNGTGYRQRYRCLLWSVSNYPAGIILRSVLTRNCEDNEQFRA